NPWWKEYSENRRRRMVKAERLKRRRERVHEEIEVLEHTEKAQVDRERQNQERLPPVGTIGSRDRPRAVEVDDRRRRNESQKSWIPPAVEHVARGEEQDVLLPPPQPPVGEDDAGQKDDIDWCVEEHTSPFVRSSG